MTVRTRSRGSVGERRVVVGGEADHLAAADAGPACARAVGRLGGGAPVAGRERREPVLEDDDVVVGGRDLASAGPAWTGTAGTRRPAAGRCGPAGARRSPPTRRAAGRSAARTGCGGGGRSRRSTASRYGVVVLVEVDELAAVGEPVTGRLHVPVGSSGASTSATISSPTSSAIRLAGLVAGRPSSVTSTSASRRAGDRAEPDRAPLGVVGEHHQPARGADQRAVGLGLHQVRGGEAGARSSIPCTPRNSMSTCSARSAATATGPTSASEGVRIPPVSTTVWSVAAAGGGRRRPGSSWSRSSARGPRAAGGRASRSWCRPRARRRCRAGRARRAARRSPPSPAAGAPTWRRTPAPRWPAAGRRVAPPCTLSSRPWLASASRSRRIVMSETPSTRRAR